MLSLLALVVLFALAAGSAGRLMPSLRPLAILASSVLVGLLACAVWWLLVFAQFVPVDSIFRSFGLDASDTAWFRVLMLGPPLLVAMVFAFVRWRR